MTPEKNCKIATILLAISAIITVISVTIALKIVTTTGYNELTDLKNSVIYNESGRPYEGCEDFMGKVLNGEAVTNKLIEKNISYCKAVKMKKIDVPQTQDNCTIFNFLKSDAGYIDGSEKALGDYCVDVTSAPAKPNFIL